MRNSFNEVARNDVIPCAPDHERRRLNLWKSGLDTVGDHVAERADITRDAASKIVRHGDPAQRPPFEQSRDEEENKLFESRAGVRIWSGTLQNQPLNALRAPDGELDQDLATERVSYKCGAAEPHCIHEAGKRIRQFGRCQDTRRHVARAKTGQVGRIDPEVRR